MKVAVGIGTLALLVELAAGSNARAEEALPRVTLRWNAPDECPDDVELLHTVEEFLGEPLAEARAQQLSVSVNVVDAKGSFAAKLRFKGPGGVEERYLEHPECLKLMEAAALLVALAIDPERVKARQQSRDNAAAAASPPPIAAPSQPVPSQPVVTLAPEPISRRDEPTLVASRPPPPKRDALRPGLEVFGFASSGVLSSTGLGLGAALGLERGHFELGLVGRYWLPRTDPVPGSQRADIQLSLWTAGARFCALPWLREWSLRGCAGVDLGDLSGTGQGLDNARTRHVRFSALSAGLSLRYGQHRLAPFAGLDGAWALEQPPFGVNVNGRQDETFRPEVLSARAFLGLAYAL
jgi:hypothetical protein